MVQQKNEHDNLEYDMFHAIFQECEIDFWGDEILCAKYLRNKSPSHAIGNKTFYQMWDGRITSIEASSRFLVLPIMP